MSDEPRASHIISIQFYDFTDIGFEDTVAQVKELLSAQVSADYDLDYGTIIDPLNRRDTGDIATPKQFNFLKDVTEKLGNTLKVAEYSNLSEFDVDFIADIYRVARVEVDEHIKSGTMEKRRAGSLLDAVIDANKELNTALATRRR